MSLYAEKEPLHEPGRRQPIGYWLIDPDHPKLFVVGHYETACGGCDTVNGMEVIYGLIEDAVLLERADVIFEGLIVASDVTRCIGLDDYANLLVVELNTSLEVCVAGIQARRDARGDDRPLSTKNTEAKMKQLIPQRKRFLDAKVDFRHLDREAALLAVKEHLGWK